MYIKYVSSILASVWLTGTAIAGTMGDEPVCNSVLCAFQDKGGLYAGVSGYYVRPAETGLGLVTDSWLVANPGGFTAESKPFTPKFKWQGSVKLGYDFPLSANNIEASYFHLSNNTHAVNTFASTGSIGFGSVLFPDAVIPIAAVPGLVSDAYLKYTLDQVDLKAGRKYTDISGGFSLRPSFGLRYAELKHNLTFAAPGNVISEYKGVGPLLSLDANYKLGHGFGLVGYFDYALLMGNISSNSYLNLVINNVPTNFAFTWPSGERVVNSLTGRLGVDYSHIFASASQVTIEAGYQASEYLNAMDTIRGFVFGGGVQHIAGHETNSFSFRGPYASLTVHI